MVAVDEPQVSVDGTKATRELGPEWQTRAQNDVQSPDNSWNPVWNKEGYRGIQTDDPTGCQLVWVATASTTIIPAIYQMPFLLQASNFSKLPWHGMEHAPGCAGLCALWLVSTVLQNAIGSALILTSVLPSELDVCLMVCLSSKSIFIPCHRRVMRVLLGRWTLSSPCV